MHNAGINCNIPTKKSPSGYKIGESDGGSGAWAEIKRPDTPAYKYQEQITGAPRGVEYDVKGVKFDGYDAEHGVLLDAKNYGKNNPLINGAPDVVVTGFLYGKGGTKALPKGGIIKEAQDQLKAAGNTKVVWHIATPEAAIAVKKALKEHGLDKIEVVVTSNTGG